jgi:sarcosine oxidase subunit alpha
VRPASAALAAAESGAQVILCDEQPADRRLRFITKPMRLSTASRATTGRRQATAELRAMDNVRVLTAHHGLRILGAEPRWPGRAGDRAPRQSRSGSLPRERLWQVRAKQVVIATGAIERHMVFANNDRPGIMLASAARTYLNHLASPSAQRSASTRLATAWNAAFDLKQGGVSDIPAIVDVRPDPDRALVARAKALGIEVLTGQAVTRHGGKLRVEIHEGRQGVGRFYAKTFRSTR